MPTPSFTGRDIISVSDFSKEELLFILKTVDQLKKNPSSQSLLNGLLMASCFFESSTRTRLSFEAAALKLGGSVMGFADPKVTSSKKGETLNDSIKIIGQYADVVVIRHPLDGSARLAAEATDKPVINAGDGANQHPTQTLLDLYTIKESQKKFDGLSIAMVGDLKNGRTVHSLTQALAHFNVRLYFVAPTSLQLPAHLCNDIRARHIKYSFHESLDDVIKKVDVLYMTRIQGERFADQSEYERVKDTFVLAPQQLEGVKKNLAVLHPLPRVSEIHSAVDATPHAWYFKQAFNGLAVRQALLALVLGKIS